MERSCNSQFTTKASNYRFGVFFPSLSFRHIFLVTPLRPLMYNVAALLEELSSVIGQHNPYRRVVVQFPDGLLGRVSSVVCDYLTSHGFDVAIAGDPSYGACDLPVHQASLFQADAIFHFGHSSFAFPPPKEGPPVHYFIVEAETTIRWDLISDEFKKMGWRTVGLVTTIQHTQIIAKAREELVQGDVHVQLFEEGQILGCNQLRARKVAHEADGILVIAGGNFHASPIVVATGRPTLRYDPFNNSFLLFGEEYRLNYLKQRYAMIVKARSAMRWGVLISVKSGQIPRDLGQYTVDLLRKAGKTAFPVMMYRVDANHLANYGDIDAWVINLCPRIATDDSGSFNKPILTTRELMVALGVLSWESFTTPSVDDHLLIFEEKNS